MSQGVRVTEGGVAEAIQALLELDFGRSAAKAIVYYADPRVALSRPEEYTGTLSGIFGLGTEHLLASITFGLGSKFGVEVHEGTTFHQLMDSLKRRGVGQKSGSASRVEPPALRSDALRLARRQIAPHDDAH